MGSKASVPAKDSEEVRDSKELVPYSPDLNQLSSSPRDSVVCVQRLARGGRSFCYQMERTYAPGFVNGIEGG